MIEDFMKALPEENVFQLYNIRKKKALELFELGIIQIKDLPKTTKLTDCQKVQHKVSKDSSTHIDKPKIKEFLDSLKYPLYNLDFETYSLAIPRFNGTKPYQQLPFQFSLHIIEKPDSEPKHISFLVEDDKDPRQAILKALKDNLGTEGSIIVYNQSFEKGRIKELGEAFPEEQSWAEAILERIIDLLHPFKSFHVYSPEQKGSASIKKVLPTYTNLSYADLLISNGADASLSFMKSHLEPCNKEEKATIRESLEKYCELDTYAQVMLLRELEEMCGKTKLISRV